MPNIANLDFQEYLLRVVDSWVPLTFSQRTREMERVFLGTCRTLFVSQLRVQGESLAFGGLKKLDPGWCFCHFVTPVLLPSFANVPFPS